MSICGWEIELFMNTNPRWPTICYIWPLVRVQLHAIGGGQGPELQI